MSDSNEVQEGFRVKRWKWLRCWGITFSGIFGALWTILLKAPDFFDLIPQGVKDLGWAGYLLLFFISFVIATIVTGFKISGDVRKLEGQPSLSNIKQPGNKQHTTERIPHMLSCELAPIPPSIKSLVASILELPDILNFLRSNKFFRLCDSHDVNKSWIDIERTITEKTRHIGCHTENTFYNFINLLHLIWGNDFLTKFLSDFRKRYKEEYKDVDFTEVESKLENLRRETSQKAVDVFQVGFSLGSTVHSKPEANQVEEATEAIAKIGLDSGCTGRVTMFADNLVIKEFDKGDKITRGFFDWLRGTVTEVYGVKIGSCFLLGLELGNLFFLIEQIITALSTDSVEDDSIEADSVEELMADIDILNNLHERAVTVGCSDCVENLIRKCKEAISSADIAGDLEAVMPSINDVREDIARCIGSH